LLILPRTRIAAAVAPAEVSRADPVVLQHLAPDRRELLLEGLGAT
jgi:hypothetical protein